ncbi:MAG TPA: hypothetical protein PLG22_18700, partial [Kiritimatiellia bacterium]|nr:hypothetical protein [Kiritimatiellia bacterium]
MSTRHFISFAFLFFLMGGATPGSAVGAVREPLYSDTFDADASRAKFQLNAHARWVEAEGRGFVLEVENPAPAAGKKAGSVAVSAPFDLKPFAGKRIIWQADIRQENVSVPPDRWNGVKCMLCFTTP